MNPRYHLKDLLKLADMAWAGSRLEDPAKLVENRKQAVLDIRRHLRDLKQKGGAGLLGELMKRRAFTQKEGLILLMLLRRRISFADPYLSGQKILKRLGGGSYDILRDLHILRSTGRLRSTRVVVSRDEDSNPEDLLGTEFTLSAWAFQAFARIIDEKNAGNDTEPLPYKKSEDVLLDHLKLHGFLHKRANSLFEIEDWEEVIPPGEAPVRYIQSQIDAHLDRMRSRRDRTEDRSLLAPIRFLESQGLTEIEEQVTMALLFRELFQGDGSAPVVELLKLVSRSKQEYLRNLGLFDADRSLVKLKILTLMNQEDGRVFSAHAVLEAWVVPAIIRGTKRGKGVPPDTWKRFRRYLENLKDSETFFRDLDKPK